MSINIELPDSLHKAVKELADKDKVSVSQFISIAVAEKISAFMTEDYIKEKAKRYDQEKFEEVMSRIPDVEPQDYDKL